MKILSDAKKDVRTGKRPPGGYDWWYFDGISSDGQYSFVVIFYEGNPFSRRYIQALQNDDHLASDPQDYPAISISIYEDEEPIYYSFTEFEKSDCSFSREYPSVKVGDHKLSSEITEEELKYELVLSEKLPSGDQLQANLTFESQRSQQLFNTTEKSEGHTWNLVQPRAEVTGEISLSDENGPSKEIRFEGRGYHDHNTGEEPMKDEFTDWYWGRYHFEYGTLVYYAMNQEDTEQHKAWLVSDDNSKILDSFDEIELLDKGLSLFGLYSARKINLRSSSAEVSIQQSSLLDNGPFYQRFKSDAFLRIADQHIVESQTGISEYIKPSRIYTRIFWPFVNMRIRYKAEEPHWVQRSKSLYRWTW